MGYFIYPGDVDKLNGRKSFSNGECVALVQATTSVGHTSQWAPGPRVVDLHFLNRGTVIANFVFDKNGIGRFPTSTAITLHCSWRLEEEECRAEEQRASGSWTSGEPGNQIS